VCVCVCVCVDVGEGVCIDSNEGDKAVKILVVEERCFRVHRLLKDPPSPTSHQSSREGFSFFCFVLTQWGVVDLSRQ
jgi:hypothetical protein